MRAIACALLAIWAFYAGKTATNSQIEYEHDFSIGGLMVIISFIFAIAATILMSAGL